MGESYSQTTWTVKPGQEDEFVRRWQEWAAWSAIHGLRGAQLFRDAERPSLFLSMGPWEDVEQIRRWRAHAGFHERMARLAEVTEHLDPRTLELVAES